MSNRPSKSRGLSNVTARACGAMLCLVVVGGCDAKVGAASGVAHSKSSGASVAACGQQTSSSGDSSKDIAGIHLGMTPKQVAAGLKCANPAYVVGQIDTIPDNADWNNILLTHDQYQPFVRVESGSVDLPSFPGQEMLRPPSPDKTEVKFLGMPGDEKAYVVNRTFSFDVSKAPPLQAAKDSLIQKYGTPTHEIDRLGSSRLNWIYDPQGKPIPANSELDEDCVVNLGNRMGAENCGLTISALITTTGEGFNSVIGIDVAMMNEAEAMARYKEEKAAITRANAATGSVPKL